ncbi:golgin A7 family, member Ba [Chanodichthys erythropterus]|uniref:golgin A7 family, member Ba n=1 Tax=Chanodichthys erythropterus TaxID=933992 RepID=UPI00351EAAB2
MISAPRTATDRTKLPYCHESFHNLQELRHSASLANKVFIQRDYTDGTICKFQTKFPSELDSRIERTLFEDTVKTLNNYYAEAEKIGGQSYLEGCLACLTVYLIFLCIETRYEKVLKKISRYIQEQNEKIYAPRGLLITDPIERGMRVVSLHSLQTTRDSNRSCETDQNTKTQRCHLSNTETTETRRGTGRRKLEKAGGEETLLSYLKATAGETERERMMMED